jgi:EAL domain-containing protein (putative c-di-GMP-specific phosphodiesterase class I)/CheY-like chemotaxis protein
VGRSRVLHLRLEFLQVPDRVPFKKTMTMAVEGSVLVSGPGTAARSSQAPATGSRLSSTGADGSRGDILIVDDEPALLRGLSRVLTERGYRVVCEPDGRAALATFRSREFDVIVTDIAMPEMDGIQLLRQLREHDAEVPVVLITGEPTVGTAVKALEYGAFHYLTKPIPLGNLEDVVDKAACLRRMARMKRQAAELIPRTLPNQSRAPLESAFYKALESLWMAYHPILRAPTGEVYGYEALLRSKEASLPHPGAVLDAAERLNMLDVLGRTIRERSAGAMQKAPEGTVLFVNLHTTDLLDPTLMSPDTPLSKMAHNVVLEITERASIDQVKDVRARVAALREMGFRIAVDDLGAGYAGLTSFALLEPEIVKLDMSLVRDVHLNSTKQKLVKSMTQLAHDMGMLVVGEGVETVQERDALVQLGCDLLQGFLFARPNAAFPTVKW